MAFAGAGNVARRISPSSFSQCSGQLADCAKSVSANKNGINNIRWPLSYLVKLFRSFYDSSLDFGGVKKLFGVKIYCFLNKKSCFYGSLVNFILKRIIWGLNFGVGKTKAMC